ncbi:MAG TPA: chromate transporter [Candidatus Acidoferrum sp.]|jgi:chromate transporter|nr:chromate transporter [Candidatus Acidoferrum sp.]
MTTQAVPVTPSDPSPKAAVVDIFVTFLIIGATSFGGGVVAYLRNALVNQKKWLDDQHFLELMSISNTLPGLNATNMSILAGDRIGGTLGSIAAMVGMCLPGFIFMTIAGILYGVPGDRVLVTAALRGVAAAAVGLLAATWWQIGKKSVKGFYDGFFILAAVVMVNYFKLSVPIALLAVGALSIFAHRPAPAHPPEKESEWIRFLR